MLFVVRAFRQYTGIDKTMKCFFPLALLGLILARSDLAVAAEARKVTLSYSAVSMTWFPVKVAVEKGFFRSEGLGAAADSDERQRRHRRAGQRPYRFLIEYFTGAQRRHAGAGHQTRGRAQFAAVVFPGRAPGDQPRRRFERAKSSPSARSATPKRFSRKNICSTSV